MVGREILPAEFRKCWPLRYRDLTFIQRVGRRLAPDNLWRAPLANAADQELADTYGSLGKAMVLYGHIHHGFVRSLASQVITNCGSVSLSYDGDPRASYAVVDNREIELRRVAYDIDREVMRLKRSNYPFAD